PLDTEEVAGLRVPTLAEMARIKAWLLATRHTVRDYLDTVVLFERLGDDGVADSLRPFDEIYRQASGVSPLAEVVERLAAAAPADKTDIDLTQYRGITPPWNDWGHLAARGRYWARRMSRIWLTVPAPLPRFWLAALASLGESVDLAAPVPDYTTQSV